VSSQIVASNIQIVPQIPEQELQAAIVDLQNELAKLPHLKERAATIVCDSPGHYAELVSLITEMQEIGKAGEVKMRPFLNISNAVTAYLHDQRRNQEREAEVAYKPHADRAAKWKREEREAAQREQDKINAENARVAREKAEAQRKADEEAAKLRRQERVKEIRAMLKRGEIGKRKAEQLLREAGATEEADKAKAAADAEAAAQNVAPVTVLPNVPKFSGRRTSVQYFAEVTHEDTLIGAYVLAVVKKDTARQAYLRQFIKADEQALGKEAREVKDSDKLNATIPGVRFWDEDKI
jgi:flagellar biosynthesis GTPase FlhF